jgi:hypothetical protein
MKRLFGVDGAADFLALFNTFASSSFFPTFNSSRIPKVLLIKSCGGLFGEFLVITGNIYMHFGNRILSSIWFRLIKDAKMEIDIITLC